MKLILFIILNLAFSSKLYSDSIYKSYDKNGNPVYSDREPDSQYETIKKVNLKPKTKEEKVEPIPAVRSVNSIRTKTMTLQQDINSIYEELHESNNSIKGKTIITFSIDKEGKVVKCDEDETGMTLASFNGKICEKISTLDYGKVEKNEATKVNYTYHFQTKK